MGLHYGNIHRADLGDGDGQKNEQFLARQYYFPVWGTCWESVAGASLFYASFCTVPFCCALRGLRIAVRGAEA